MTGPGCERNGFPMRLSILILAFFLQGTHAVIAQDAKEGEQQLTIIDTRNNSDIPEMAEPKAGDVIIERTIFLGEGYMVAFFPKRGNTIGQYSAFQETNDDYDIAFYKWSSPNAVDVRLVNSKTEAELKFQVYHQGNQTGIIKLD